MAEMTVTVVTPEETVLEAMASSLVLPLFDGEVGILPKHAPMIGRLGYGEMRIVPAKGATADGPTSLYVDGGFVQVAGDEINVMTNRAMELHEIDHVTAEESLKASLGLSASGEEAIHARQRTIDQARAQVRLAKKSK